MKASLREIRDGIINAQSPYQQQTGLFSLLLSPERKQAWHFINQEHLLSIQNQSLSNIEQIIQYGIINNAKNLKQINNSLSELDINISLGFNKVSNEIKKTNELLNNSNLILQGILEALLTPEATKAKEKARLASQNIKDAVNLRSDRAKILLDESLILLQQSIEISPFDYRAHFDLGYLYSFYKKKYKKAETCFDNAVLRALNKDNEFAAYSLRHLADTRKHLGNLNGALEAIKEAFEINSTDNKIQFEYAQFLVLNNQIEKANELIYDLVTKNPAYFDVAITDTIIATKNIILNKLLNLRYKLIEQITSNLIESKKNYWNNKYVHTKLKNFFGKEKKDYSNIRLNNVDKNRIKGLISNQIIKEVNELPFEDLFNNNTYEIENNLKKYIQTQLNSLLKDKGKKVFGNEIYLGKK